LLASHLRAQPGEDPGCKNAAKEALLEKGLTDAKTAVL